MRTLEGEVRKWFRGLPADSLNSWHTLEQSFVRKWGEKRDHLYFLAEFVALEKNNGETTSEFNKRFNKIYKKISQDINTSQATTKVTYVGDYEVEFAMILR